MASVVEREAVAASAQFPSDSRLCGQIMPMCDVDEHLTDSLYELFAKYYRNVDRGTFDRDQAAKDWLLLLVDERGVVRGFSTAVVYDLDHFGRKVRAVFSGNTIIEHRFWGKQELVRTFGTLLASLKRETRQTPLYWFLVCSGFRTYMFLPLFCREFYPRNDRATPPFEQALIDRLGAMKFPDEYHDGVVNVQRPRECLLPELAIPTPARLRNPHVRFFVDRNPAYPRGNELVCVAEFSAENVKGLLGRLARDEVSASAALHIATTEGSMA